MVTAYTAEEIREMQKRIKDLEDALTMALPYVAGAYECAFPDEQENIYVKETIEQLLNKKLWA